METTLRQLSKEVYETLGAGHCERVYQNALNLELQMAGLNTILEYPVNIDYKGHTVSLCYCDILLVQGNTKTPIEIKAISRCSLKDKLQTEKYIHNIFNANDGFLINFGLHELEFFAI